MTRVARKGEGVSGGADAAHPWHGTGAACPSLGDAGTLDPAREQKATDA